MTSLNQRKTRLVFETAGTIRERGKHREIVIQAEPFHAEVRLKGTRKKFLISWEGIYIAAAKIAADRARMEKKAARKAKYGKP